MFSVGYKKFSCHEIFFAKPNPVSPDRFLQAGLPPFTPAPDGDSRPGSKMPVEV
jgi:hypothetical protein